MDDVYPIRDGHWMRYNKGVRRGGRGGGRGGGFGRGWHGGGGWGHRGWGGRGLGSGYIGWGYPYYWDYPVLVARDECARLSSMPEMCDNTVGCVMYGGRCIPQYM